ncbi:MAG: Bax inhibitor-1/YccA family protein, partial [Ignavibacteria bacterium]|nr:Bax inhibitor-1/YccA family protein [Ignavibacteria bacterium]
MDEQLYPSRVLSADAAAEIQRAFMVKVFSWMMVGLMITGIVALFVLQSETLVEALFASRFVFFGLIIGQLALVVWLAARIAKMSATTATMVFLGYSALTGVTFALIFLLYTAASIATTFFVTAATFGAMSAYGYVTRRDLTSWGSFLMMGLVGIIIASVVNIWLDNSTVYWITTYIGVLVFVGLTAYDTQKIKQMSVATAEGGEAEQKAAIMGALKLYLDF